MPGGCARCPADVYKRQVSHGAEHEFRVLIGVDSPGGLEGRGCVAVRIALFIGVAHIMLRLRAFLDVLERRSSGPGQRLLLLTQDPDEHDEGLKAGGGSLQDVYKRQL